ncbi:uncharacterized protein LOC135096168 isoform X6 [Scylla paramamosain]|uniref:uncharacterized protein LOC135096168 isoform X6 n=1 Tax=Scylla paramamosain TaxID=85552 RepID=UPI003083A523
MSGKTEEMGRQQNQTSRTAVVREQDPTSKFPIHSAPETLRSVASKSSRPFCSRAPQDISGERQKDPTSKPSHPFCPRVHQVIGRHVLLSILPQSPSGARLASSGGTPSVHPRCSPSVPAELTTTKNSVAMEDVMPGSSSSSSMNRWEQLLF